MLSRYDLVAELVSPNSAGAAYCNLSSPPGLLQIILSADQKVKCTFDICPVPGIGLERSLHYAAQPVTAACFPLSLRATAVTFYVQIYERDVMFRQQVGNLQLIVGIYNDVQATILPVEKPLITQKLEAVDAALKKGLQVNVCKSCIRYVSYKQTHAQCNTLRAHQLAALQSIGTAAASRRLALQTDLGATLCRHAYLHFICLLTSLLTVSIL